MTQVPQPVSAPVCYRHNSRETYVRCTRCDRPICNDCMREAAVGHQCPECVAEGRRTQRPVRTAFGGSTAGAHGYVTFSLIAINCVVMLLSILSTKSPGSAVGGGGLGGLLGGSTPLSEHLAVFGRSGFTNGNGGPIFYQPDGVASGEYYRLFTAMFVHYGVLHLAANMWALWVLGRPLEAMFGPIRFLAVYLVCGLGGNVACYLFSPNSHSAGASTAIFGLFAVLFFVFRKLNISVAQLVPLLIINLVITFSVPGISRAGHIGGLITGAIVGAAFAYAPQARRTHIQAAVIVVMCLLFAGIAFWQTGQLNA
jgi:membrane associated rhomboid family serine protease